MSLKFLSLFLAVLCLCSYELNAAGYGCAPSCDPCATSDGQEQATAPQPCGDLPTVCYKPYRYYTPKYNYTCECDDVEVPCQKKCCRMVPKYYEQTYCKYEPKYYTQTYCKYEPEYYYENDCKHVKQYHYEKHCSYEPHTYYQKECGPTAAPSCAPAYNSCAPAPTCCN